MNCSEVQRLIMPFINDELSITQLEEFVHHVRSCPNCMEELEVYYVLLAGMKQLDEDKELSNDFHHDLMELLRFSEERIIHDKFLHIRKRIVLVLVISVVAVISSLRFGEYVVEDVLTDEVKESNFLMKGVFLPEPPLEFKTGKMSEEEDSSSLNSMIVRHLTDIYVYLRIKDPESADIMMKKFGDRIWEGVNVPGGVGVNFDRNSWIIDSY